MYNKIRITYHIAAATHTALEVLVLSLTVKVFPHVIVATVVTTIVGATSTSAKIVTDIVAHVTEISDITRALLVLLSVQQ